MRHRFITPDARLRFFAPADSRSSAGRISGYAILFNVLSTDRGGYKVRILPGAPRFTTPTMALYHHEWRDVLGSTANGTVRLFPDATGIRADIELANTTVGRDVASLVGRRDVTGMSFSMVEDPRVRITREDGVEIHNAQSFLVDEVTVTASPAFLETNVATVSDADAAEYRPPIPASPYPSPYASRRDQQHQLDRLRLGMLRLPPEPARH